MNYASHLVVGDLSIEQLEAEIESLGFQAAQIELWNAEPGTPPWMRRMDAERVEDLRNKQAQLLGELALKKLRARDHLSEKLPRIDVGIQPKRGWTLGMVARFAVVAAYLVGYVWLIWHFV